jgi:F-box interacting protein
MPRHGHEAPLLPDEVIVNHILTRVPAIDTVRFRAVCREWRAAIASDHFGQAYQAVRAAAAQPPEIIFFAPGAAAGSTTFYSSRLSNQKLRRKQSSSSSADDDPLPAQARELVTVGNLRASNVVLSGTKPCRGLTLLFQQIASAYHVCNLSTGEHVSLPPCAPAWRDILNMSSYVLSSAGLGFDPAANEHKVVRLYEDCENQQRCEVYGLRSGGWRPCAGGQAPAHAGKGLQGSPPVFLDGCFYWCIDCRVNFISQQDVFSTPERILSFSVSTEEFGWVRAPEERAHDLLELVELDGSLCAVVDLRLTIELFELWTRTAPDDDDPGTRRPPWSLSIRISLATLPQPMRDDMGRGIRMLPLANSAGGKILLGTSCHVVFAYDPESSRAERVFSVEDFVDAPGEAGLLLRVALHEESVTGVRHRRPAAGDRSTLKMRLGSSTIACRRGVAAGQHRNRLLDVTPKLVQMMIGPTMDQWHDIINMYNQ